MKNIIYNIRIGDKNAEEAYSILVKEGLNPFFLKQRDQKRAQLTVEVLEESKEFEIAKKYLQNSEFNTSKK